jgi:hypothetical protein
VLVKTKKATDIITYKERRLKQALKLREVISYIREDAEIYKQSLDFTTEYQQPNKI